MNRLKSTREDHEVAREPHPLGERAGDQRRRDDRELQLEEREEHERDRRARARLRAPSDAAEHEERRGLPMTPPMLSPKARLKPTTTQSEADDAHRDEALQHRRDDVLALHHAAVEERQPRRHQQDERRRRSASTPRRPRRPGRPSRRDRRKGRRSRAGSRRRGGPGETHGARGDYRRSRTKPVQRRHPLRRVGVLSLHA